MPFLSILTRTYQRPEALKQCKRSVAMQADQDLEHLILRDTVGVGVVEAYRLLLNVQPRGEYVMILDDDDLLTSPWFVSDLKAASRAYDPDVIVFKMQSEELGVLPDAFVWQQKPIHGRIGGSNVAVKLHVWDECIWAIATDGEGGDPETGEYEYKSFTKAMLKKYLKRFNRRVEIYFEDHPAIKKKAGR